MNCWECFHVMGPVDIRQQKSNDRLRQTEYKCSNCGSVYLVSTHKLAGPSTDFVKITSEEGDKLASRPKDNLRPR